MVSSNPPSSNPPLFPWPPPVVADHCTTRTRCDPQHHRDSQSSQMGDGLRSAMECLDTGSNPDMVRSSASEARDPPMAGSSSPECHGRRMQGRPAERQCIQAIGFATAGERGGGKGFMWAGLCRPGRHNKANV